MSELGLRVAEGKALLLCNGNEKEIPKDSILQVCQLLLTHLAPNRDYTNVTSVKKLLRIIDLECVADDSESEDGDEEPVKKPAPAARGRKPAPKTVKKTPAKPAAKIEPKVESEDEDDEDEDDES